MDQLIPLVPAELRRMARRQMGHERRGRTLQATALVNEAYLRLIDVRQVPWQTAHFFAMSARLMRRTPAAESLRVPYHVHDDLFQQCPHDLLLQLHRAVPIAPHGREAVHEVVYVPVDEEGREMEAP